MSEKFDPLRAWLGVSSGEKPSYYDLIGLANFESEPPIIADAADSAIAKVSEHLGGPHQAVAEKLVRDLKSLKAVLLSADKRRAYDEQLGKKLGVAVPSNSSPALNGALPRAVDAADSPTMMLPPGALSGMRSLDDVLSSAPPSAAGFGGQPGFPPGALPPGAMPPGAMPPGAGLPGAMPTPGFGAPQFGGQPYGAPQPNAPFGDPQFGGQPAPYGAPMGHAPNPYQQPPFGAEPNAGFNPNAGYQNPGFPNQGYANPGFGAPTGPQPMFPGSMNPGQMHPGPMGAGPGFDPHGAGNPFGAPASPGVNLGLGGPSALPGSAPSFNSSPGFGGGTGFSGGPASATLPRPSAKPKPRPIAAKSQGSNMTVALMVLGAAVVVLTVVIVVVQKNKGDSGPPPLVAGKPKDNVNKPLPVAPSPAVAKPLLSQTLPPAPVLGPTVKDQAITIDISQERNMRGRPGNDLDPRTNTDTLVPMLTGGKPIPAASGTGPAAMPVATAKPATPAAMPTESTTGLKGVVIPQVAMEAGLPEDATRAKTVPTMLKGSRGSMKARDYAKAEETTLSALITADTPALVKKAQEHARALELLQSFWTSVRDGIKSLKAGDELPVSGKVATVVKGEAGSLVVKMDGKDIAMVIDKLPPALAVLLAEKAIGNEKPESKLVIGTFLAVDQGADAARGFTLIEEAAGGEIVVDELIDILKSTD